MLSSSTIFSNIFSKHHPSFYIPAVFKSLSSTPSNYKSEQHILLSKLRSAIFSDPPPRLSDPTIRDFVLTVNEYSDQIIHLNQSKSKLAQAESVNMDHLSLRKDLLLRKLRSFRAARTGDLVWYVPNQSHPFPLSHFHTPSQVRCKIPKHDSISSTHVKILSPQKTMSRFVFRALSNSILRRGFVSTSILDSR